MAKKKNTTGKELAVLESARAKLNEVLSAITPGTKALTPEERRKLPKMGEKTLKFVEKAHEFARQNPSIVPAFVSIDEMERNLAKAHSLWPAINTARQLEKHLVDTELCAGSDALMMALAIYHAAELAARRGVPGTKAVYDELSVRFPGRGKKSKAGPPVPVEPPGEEKETP
jgi:hypothetical protein